MAERFADTCWNEVDDSVEDDGSNNGSETDSDKEFQVFNTVYAR